MHSSLTDSQIRPTFKKKKSLIYSLLMFRLKCVKKGSQQGYIQTGLGLGFLAITSIFKIASCVTCKIDAQISNAGHGSLDIIMLLLFMK